MKNRYTQRPFDFDKQEIETLAKNFGIDAENDFLLKKYCPHIEQAETFFSDGENGLFDANLMLNMNAAVEKIRCAQAENKKILIFGDYDADGISASAILTKYFTSQNINNFVYLPKRSEGYGLKIETLMRLHNEHKFDLIVTVDCGITAIDEVEFVKKILRKEIIVTDHHEPGERIPDCICVNPKLGYVFRDLSGSGVALKLVQALSSAETAKFYCDLASIGTIGDIMPMESENRAIVKMGCRHINNLGLKSLLKANKIDLDKVDCNAIAMKVCPKINAAGRIDEPTVALELLLAESEEVAATKVKALMSANTERQKLTEIAYAQAIEYIEKNNLTEFPAIFVYGENWKHGILGLVANKLVEKYKVPVGAFMPDGDNIVGSLRAPEGIDLFSVVSQLKNLVLKFGGHKMSVGVTIFKDVFQLFYKKFIENLSETGIESPEIYYDAIFRSGIIEKRFINQLKSFEPILPNNKLIFYGKFSVKSLNVFGKNKNYIKILTDNNFELKTFADCTEIIPALKTNCNFECIFTVEYEDFSARYVGNMIDINILDSISFDDLYLRNYLDKVSFEKPEIETETISVSQIEYFTKESNCCCVFGSMLEFENIAAKADFSSFYLNFFVPRQTENTVLISPINTVDFSKFKNVICFNHYNYEIEKIESEENIFLCEEKSGIPAYLYGQKINRDDCAKVFRAVVRNLQQCIDIYDLYLKCGVFEYTYGNFLYILKIFEELKIFTVVEKPFSLVYNKGIKVVLTDSRLFNMIASKTTK